jgi:hypothetical protein
MGAVEVRAYEAMRDHDEKCEFAVSMENERVSAEYGSLLLVSMDSKGVVGPLF